jgi:O-antigen ligase
MSLVLPMIWLRFAHMVDTGGSGRLSIWKTGLHAAGEYWLFGAGIDNFSNAYDTAYVQVFQRYGAGWGRAAHDILLQNLVELGIVGVILLGIALIAQFRLVSGIDLNDDLHDSKLMVQGAMLALVVAAMFIDLVMYKYAWLVFATMAQLRAVHAAECAAPRVEVEEPSRIPALAPAALSSRA